MQSLPPNEGGTPSKRPPALRSRPSRSEPPGPSRLFAMLTVDPWYLVFRFVVAIVEGATTGVLKWREKRRAERDVKKANKASKRGK